MEKVICRQTSLIGNSLFAVQFFMTPPFSNKISGYDKEISSKNLHTIFLWLPI